MQDIGLRRAGKLRDDAHEPVFCKNQKQTINYHLQVSEGQAVLIHIINSYNHPDI